MLYTNDIEPHPAAEVFRRMTDDELAELAEDIAENGLRDPIVLDQNGRIIDGRNRLAACRKAGVEPHFTTFQGDEAAINAFVWSRGGLRRNVSAGMRAMAAALLYPSPERGKRTDLHGETCSRMEQFGVGRAKVSEARTVLKHTPDAVPLIQTGGLSLADAYKKALEIKREQERDALATRSQVEIIAEHMAALRREAPDLAERVEDGKTTLTAAQAALDDRRRTEKAQRANLFHFLDQIVVLDSISHGRGLEEIVRVLREYPQEYAAQSKYTVAELMAACRRLPDNLKAIREGVSG